MILFFLVFFLACVILFGLLYQFFVKKRQEDKRLMEKRQNWASDVSSLQDRIERELKDNPDILESVKMLSELLEMLAYDDKQGLDEPFYRQRLNSFHKRYGEDKKKE